MIPEDKVRICVIGDGAPWIWNRVKELYPNAKSDIREKIREKRIGNFIVFVVDASGSMGAGKRMIETKGAILSLLLDAYQKRDKIAMVAFKGDHAEVLLLPTGSIELAPHRGKDPALPWDIFWLPDYSKSFPERP